MAKRERFLDEAHRIGRQLAEGAVRVRDRCTWIVRTPPPPGPQAGERPASATAADATVYAGTAGIALFLSRLARHVDDRSVARTAAAAARHAVAAVRHPESLGRPGAEARFGAYGGVLGSAWAALEVEGVQGGTMARKASTQLVERLRRGVGRGHDRDLINGAAGAIPILHEFDDLGIRGARELAEALGRDLVANARRAGATWSWKGPLDRHGGPPLTGFSHGASGIGWALTRLHDWTGVPELGEAAAGAFAYEDTCFDAGRRNWPRYDIEPGPDGRPVFYVAWCHGAPGIGLARVRSGVRVNADAAFATSRNELARHMRSPGIDLSLCHGGLGIADCLAEMDEAGARGADRMADWALERFGGAARERWGASIAYPTVLPYGEHPSLLNGLAGIGHFFLRRAVADEPSVLVPGN